MVQQPETSHVETSNVEMSNVEMSNVETSNVETSNVEMSNLECVSQAMCNLDQDAPHSLLATARVRVKNAQNAFKEIRVVCDSGAQVNLLSDSAFRRLKVEREVNRCSVVGVGGSPVVTMGRVTLEIWHHTQNVLIDKITFTIIGGLKMCHPQHTFPPIQFSHIGEHDLADHTYNENAPVDGIIGVNVLSRHLGYSMQPAPFDLMTQESSFGWIVFGGRAPEEFIDMLTTVNVTTTNDLYNMVKKLWEIDEVIDWSHRTTDELSCENLYESTLERREGRYAVTLLLRPEAELGHSRTMAERRLYSLERRFQREPGLREKYIDFMREYERLGHMQKASPLIPTRMHYYIPHHAVAILKNFRVVFDASAKTTNGKSLNDVQFVGPRLQSDLADILMNFRIGRVAISADIAKMFRQIQIQACQWDLQRILWRESPKDPIIEYWLTVVTYGMASSPYNAVKTLNQCALDHGSKHFNAASAVLTDFYVDDLLSSRDSEAEALELKQELVALLKKGGFHLTKWCSNYAAIMNEELDAKLMTERDSTSVLGIIWNYRTDEFQFKVQSREQPAVLTKRLITSEAAKIFDPQGYVAPVTVRSKMFIQEQWRVKKDWDEALPQQLQIEWKAYCAEVKGIEQYRIPRWLGTSATTQSQVHVFCDASARAYGAAVYIRTQVDGNWSAKLLCSRSKVAPLKTMTIPRLELCAMDVGRKLVRKIRGMPAFNKSAAFMWTDSEIVLYWLRKPEDELKVFVQNRVRKVLREINIDQARHIRSEQNPADLLSRGTHVSTLMGNELWWNGPEMLQQSNDDWPQWKATEDAQTMEIVGSEIKRVPLKFDHVLLTTITDAGKEMTLVERWSAYRKTCRITAYVLRFCSLLYRPLAAKEEPRIAESYWLTEYGQKNWMAEAFDTVTYDTKKRGTVHSRLRLPSMLEMRVSLKYWAMLSQQEAYPDELKAVANGRPLERRNPLFALTPRIDHDQLLRICGRLGNTNLPYEVKHPIILSRHTRLANQLAEEAHYILGHGGVETCTQFLRNKFWIVGIRVLLRSVIKECTVCTRYRENPENQFMADIPARRLDVAPAFEYTGVDYAGPISLKLTRNTSTKGWIAVFVCMRYRTVHLELVSSLDTSAFLAALQRFVNLRGGCVQHMHSDRGTNFIGAARELREAAESWDDHRVVEYLTLNAIEWHNITPMAPHHGGVWESMVKIVKTHLKKMAGAHLFTFEELATLLTKISAIINSRPLTPLSTDPSDLTALTPSHFLSTRPIVSPLEPQLANVPLNRLTAWQRIAKLQQDFANRWRQECFSELQRRNKWAGVHRALQVGDLVLIRDDHAPACRWPMGRVIEVFRGRDGHVRSCKLKTERTEIERPITKLCLLPVDHDDENASDAGFCPKDGFSQHP